LEAELLLGKVLGLDRTRLYIDYDRPLEEDEIARFRELLLIRARDKIPLAYLIGEKSFGGLSFFIPRGVFIPRPETEELVEAVAARIRKKEAFGGSTFSVLDLCTGSGAVAVTLARMFPGALILAVDISPVAVQAARANAARHGVGERVTAVVGDLFTAVEAGRLFAVVVANPPYIPTPAMADLPREIREYEPREALDGGPDGLTIIRRIVEMAPRYLLPGGLLALEHGHDQGEALATLAAAAGLVGIAIQKDLAGRPRILLAEKPKA
ncbi:MAG: peptide chain release factor N(5)-glutamine methyltransferase, partial [Firmicutes bacterium]|nr:peptide chain release factor N(5)-glutamine methyltransferase [Bacillota bacterium]